MGEAATPLYDVVIVPENLDYRVSEGMASSYLTFLRAMRVFDLVDEAIHRDWVELYMVPDDAGHHPFAKRGYEGDRPWLEMVMRWGKEKIAVPGSKSDKTYFFVEFRGCVFKEPIGMFLNRMKKMLHFHPKASWHEHKGLPEHKVVAEEDMPERIQMLKRSAGEGRVGMRVEDLFD